VSFPALGGHPDIIRTSLRMFNESAEKVLPVIASKAKQSPFEIAELVPSVSEESRSEFASAMPRNR